MSEDDLLQPATRADIHRLRGEMTVLIGNLTNEVRTQNGRITRVEDTVKLVPPPTEFGALLARFTDALADIGELRTRAEANRLTIEAKTAELRTALEVRTKELKEAHEASSRELKQAHAATNRVVVFGTGGVAAIVLILQVWGDKIFG